MKVILVQAIKKLGALGQIVDVKGGFGRNFLISQGKALRATKQNKELFEARKIEIEKKSLEQKIQALDIANLLNGKTYNIIKQAGDDGRLYGSVSSKDISKLISPIFAEVNYSNIILREPIKTTGVTEVEVSVYGDVNAKILIVVAKSENEAQEYLKGFISKNKKEEKEVAAEE